MSTQRPMFDPSSFDVIPPELVHKRAASEVLVKGVVARADGWILRTVLPLDHNFHSDAVGRQSAYHDPLFVLEALRQGCIAGAHLFYAVPLDFHYTVRFYEFAVVDWTALESVGESAEFEFHTVIRREYRPAAEAQVTGVDITAIARRNGITAMELAGGFGWMATDQWQSMRTGSTWRPGRQPDAADPLSAGRTRSENVVIGSPVQGPGERSVCAPIVVDTGNPTFFDHPLDHLPGGLIMEAYRQLALAIQGPRSLTVVGPSRLRCDFHSFAELDPGCIAELAATDEPLGFRGVVNQSGSTRASVELAFASAEALT